jgi:hypothetical protein
VDLRAPLLLAFVPPASCWRFDASAPLPHRVIPSEAIFADEGPAFDVLLMAGRISARTTGQREVALLVGFYSRKKVVATAAVIQTRRHTAFFETGALSHKHTSRCVLAFQLVPCRNGRHGALFQLGFRRDILCGVYLNA